MNEIINKLSISQTQNIKYRNELVQNEENKKSLMSENEVVVQNLRDIENKIEKIEIETVINKEQNIKHI